VAVENGGVDDATSWQTTWVFNALNLKQHNNIRRVLRDTPLAPGLEKFVYYVLPSIADC